MKKAEEQEFIIQHVMWTGGAVALCGTLTDCPGSPASPGLPWKPCGPCDVERKDEPVMTV